MGNGQSAEDPRRPTNKLSKPRTNSSTNLLNLKNTGSSSRQKLDSNNGANRFSTVLGEAVVGGEGERGESTQKKRMSMFRSKSAQPKSEPLQINSGVDIEFLERGPADNWSTRGSVTHESPDQPYYAAPAEGRPPARAARMSLQHVPYAQPLRLSLVAEAPTPQPDQWESPRRMSFVQNEPVEIGTSDMIQREESPKPTGGLPERKNSASEMEMFAPIRRRSLLQHGIATRTSWVENDARQSLPSQLPSKSSQDDLQNYYYNPDKPTSSPLSTIAALGPRFEDSAPNPRTMTPNDLDYGHIGAFKLGSLRITNGAASPTPSMDRPATSGADEDYFNDGRRNTSDHMRTGQRSSTILAPQEMNKTPWVTTAESPLRQAYEPEEVPLRVNTHLPLPEFSAFNFETESPTKSQDLAQEYMQDLALSPFSFDNSPPRTPRLEATSKHTAVEDDLFAPEPSTPVIQEMHEPRSFDSGFHAEETQVKIVVNGPRDPAHKPLAKADSGYSSNVSLRSFKGASVPAVPAKEAPPTPPKNPVSRDTSSTYSVTSSYSSVSAVTIKSKRSLPALPTDDMPAPFREAPPVPLKNSSVHTSGRVSLAPSPPRKLTLQEAAYVRARARSQVTPPKHARQQSLPAVPPWKEEPVTISDHSPSGSTGSSTKTSSTSSRWRREKKRPESMQPPTQPVYTVQAFRNTSENISVPPVPLEASRNLEKRVDGFPIASFPNTYAGTTNLRRTVSKETLGTIFSVGSAEYREEPTHARLQSALPSIPLHATIPEIPSPGPEANRRYTYQVIDLTPPPSVSKAKHRKSLPSIPRKATPSKLSQQTSANETSSDENVSSNVGKSTYGAARGPAVTDPAVQARAKSMTSQLEAEARARFARARSVSQESIQTVQRRTSYESISHHHSHASTTSLPQVSTSRPPQAHSRWSGLGLLNTSPKPPSIIVQQPSDFPDGDDGKRLSARIQERIRSPPPVSMQTQRNPTPKPSRSPARTPPPPPQQAPDRTPPQPPAHFSPPVEQDQWKEQKNFWADRRKSAGEVLRGRKSVEMRRPENRRPSPAPQPRLQKAKSYGSWDASTSSTRQYDHTYGSYEQNKENLQQRHQQQQQSEYYDGPSADVSGFEQEQLPRALHKRQTSTSGMLVLDRYSGGFGFGYEPGAGLGGSAGTRNAGNMAAGGRKSVGDSMRFGVDFSDVPVFLTRVKAES